MGFIPIPASGEVPNILVESFLLLFEDLLGQAVRSILHLPGGQELLPSFDVGPFDSKVILHREGQILWDGEKSVTISLLHGFSRRRGGRCYILVSWGDILSRLMLSSPFIFFICSLLRRRRS